LRTMTSKERVISALEHRQPDRVPCDYFGTPEIDEQLKKHFAVKTNLEILEKLHTDIRTTGADYIGDGWKTLEDGSTIDYWGIIRKPMANEYGQYSEPSNFPFKDMKTMADVNAYPWPSTDDYDYKSVIPNIEKFDGYAVGTGGFGTMDLINGTAFGRTFEQLLLDLATEDPVGIAIIDKRFNYYYELCKRTLEAGKGKFDLLLMGDDYGTQNGLLASPAFWRRFFKPRMKKMIDLAHKHGCKVIHHSCGSTRAIIPDFIEIGLDCLQTIQERAAGMEPNELKRLYGDKISFHGAIDVQGRLQSMTVEETKAYVKDRIEKIGAGGGYICAPSHNIQPDTPFENVLAMYEAIEEYGYYKG